MYDKMTNKNVLKTGSLSNVHSSVTGLQMSHLYTSGMASAGVSCKYHPHAPLIEDYRAGDLICPECGLVVGDRVIDVGSEWRSVVETQMIQ